MENGRLAVERAEKGTFDVVLMDMNMPEMDGYEGDKEAPRSRILSSDSGVDGQRDDRRQRALPVGGL